MTAVAVKTEDFVSLDINVRLVTYDDVYGRYYAIVRDGKVSYLSPVFYGQREEVVRSCDSALDVVRFLLKETGFLTGKVVGS